RVLAAPRAIAPRVQRAIHGHPIHPREELAAAFELRERAECAKKHVLCDIVGVAARARDVQREREDPLAIALDQRLERAMISRLRGGNQRVRGRGLALGLRHRWSRWSRHARYRLRRLGYVKALRFVRPTSQ